MKAFVIAALAASPLPALACGGLFCNTAQPVTQAAERILFARMGDQVQMHVRLTWDGPPQDFGWLLPVPPDVETALSSESLFSLLDQAYAPIFRLNTEFLGCDDFFNNQGGAGGSGGGAGGEGGAGGGGGVNVLSREQVGPYDRTILQGESVQALLGWLGDNGYQVPVGADDTLQPYVDLGAAFVAIKLVPGADSSEVVPLALTFTANGPAIPLRPTANAANPDMGIIVHVLGEHRAIPANFRHVQINEAAIDWTGSGQNYPDVVSQAADESGGMAFVTDYAGPANNARPPVLSTQNLGANPTWEMARSFLNVGDPDVQRVLIAVITDPGDGESAANVVACPFCYENVEIDGAALVRRILEEINPPREALGRLFEAHLYMTRLYTTMSPEEMEADPIFDENPDLDPVANLHQATQFVTCDASGPRFDTSVIQTGSGLRFALRGGANPDAIQRQAGATVRGVGVPAASVIEQMMVAGQPVNVEDRRSALAERYDAPVGAGGGGGTDAGAGADGGSGGGVGGSGGSGGGAADGSDDGGCDGCSTTGTSGAGLAFVLLAALRPRRRRR